MDDEDASATSLEAYIEQLHLAIYSVEDDKKDESEVPPKPARLPDDQIGVLEQNYSPTFLKVMAESLNGLMENWSTLIEYILVNLLNRIGNTKILTPFNLDVPMMNKNHLFVLMIYLTISGIPRNFVVTPGPTPAGHRTCNHYCDSRGYQLAADPDNKVLGIVDRDDHMLARVAYIRGLENHPNRDTDNAIANIETAITLTDTPYPPSEESSTEGADDSSSAANDDSDHPDSDPDIPDYQVLHIAPPSPLDFQAALELARAGPSQPGNSTPQEALPTGQPLPPPSPQATPEVDDGTSLFRTRAGTIRVPPAAPQNRSWRQPGRVRSQQGTLKEAHSGSNRRDSYTIFYPRVTFVMLALIMMFFSTSEASGYDPAPTAFLLGEHQPVAEETMHLPDMRDGCEIILTISARPNSVDSILEMDTLGHVYFEVTHPNFEDECQMPLSLRQDDVFIPTECTICFSSCKNVSNDPFTIVAHYNKPMVIDVNIEAREGRHNCEPENTSDAWSNLEIIFGAFALVFLLLIIVLLVLLFKKYKKTRRSGIHMINDCGRSDFDPQLDDGIQMM